LMIGLMIGPSTPAVAGEEPQYGGTLKVANSGDTILNYSK